MDIRQQTKRRFKEIKLPVKPKNTGISLNFQPSRKHWSRVDKDTQDWLDGRGEFNI